MQRVQGNVLLRVSLAAIWSCSKVFHPSAHNNASEVAHLLALENFDFEFRLALGVRLKHVLGSCRQVPVSARKHKRQRALRAVDSNFVNITIRIRRFAALIGQQMFQRSQIKPPSHTKRLELLQQVRWKQVKSSLIRKPIEESQNVRKTNILGGGGGGGKTIRNFNIKQIYEWNLQKLAAVSICSLKKSGDILVVNSVEQNVDTPVLQVGDSKQASLTEQVKHKLSVSSVQKLSLFFSKTERNIFQVILTSA
jgi:hypothetical protein